MIAPSLSLSDKDLRHRLSRICIAVSMLSVYGLAVLKEYPDGAML